MKIKCWRLKSYTASLCSNLWHSLCLRGFKLKIHYPMKHLSGKRRILLCWRSLHHRRRTNMTSNIKPFPHLSLFFFILISVLRRNVKMTEMLLTWADSSSRRLFSSSASISFCLVISSSLFRASAFSSAWNTKSGALKRLSCHADAVRQPWAQAPAGHSQDSSLFIIVNKDLFIAINNKTLFWKLFF